MKKYLLFLLPYLFIGASLHDQMFISEIHYDDGAVTSTDDDEAIEVYVENPQPANLSLVEIVLYNGSNGTVYGTETLASYTAVPTPDGVYYFLIYPTNGIQNGSPDGIALVNDGTVVEFISYEGTLTAVDGPAMGMTSVDIGVSENGSTVEGTSMQNDGFGNWVTGVAESFGEENASNLPVELIAFEGKNMGTYHQLAWTTATELNNEKFIIERSTDGARYEAVGSVEGFGTTTEVISYEFMDESPVAGMNYYRLKQMDFDGQFEYSQTILIENRSTNEVNVYPTMVQAELTVVLEEDENGTLSIFDVMGREILQVALTKKQNYINVSSLQNGNYFAVIQSSGNTTTKRIIKQ